jgi:hypothetical protein
MANLDMEADILLKETATRQLMVDRLLGWSAPQEYAMRMIVPIAAGAVGLFAWSAWGDESQQRRPQS